MKLTDQVSAPGRVHYVTIEQETPNGTRSLSVLTKSGTALELLYAAQEMLDEARRRERRAFLIRDAAVQRALETGTPLPGYPETGWVPQASWVPDEIHAEAQS